MSGDSAIIMAGGDGTRRRSLTRVLAGDERPKQFCRILASTDLSRQVFQAEPAGLAVLPVSGVGWNDLGDPARVRATQARLGRELAPA